MATCPIWCSQKYLLVSRSFDLTNCITCTQIVHFSHILDLSSFENSTLEGQTRHAAILNPIFLAGKVSTFDGTCRVITHPLRQFHELSLFGNRFMASLQYLRMQKQTDDTTKFTDLPIYSNFRFKLLHFLAKLDRLEFDTHAFLFGSLNYAEMSNSETNPECTNLHLIVWRCCLHFSTKRRTMVLVWYICGRIHTGRWHAMTCPYCISAARTSLLKSVVWQMTQKRWFQAELFRISSCSSKSRNSSSPSHRLNSFSTHCLEHQECARFSPISSTISYFKIKYCVIDHFRIKNTLGQRPVTTSQRYQHTNSEFSLFSSLRNKASSHDCNGHEEAACVS